MRNKIFITFLLITSKILAQTEGISYQAVILDNNVSQVPGINSSNNILRSSDVSFEFTILDSSNSPLYRETQTTKTDMNGLVHLVIGRGSASIGLFNEVKWDGDLKMLSVAIDINGGNNFSFLAEQSFLYLPYEKHRDIDASGNINSSGNISASGDISGSGNLDVFGDIDVGGDLEVEGDFDIGGNFYVTGMTGLNDNLAIKGDTYVKGVLSVDGGTILNIVDSNSRNSNNALIVNGETLLDGSFSVVNGSLSTLSGVLNVDGSTFLNNSLNVIGATQIENSLSVSETLNVNGATLLNDVFEVSSASTSTLTGSLNVDGITELNNSLIVTNSSSSVLSGSLDVDGATVLNDSFTVEGSAKLNGVSLVVLGETILFNTLDVVGATALNNAFTVVGSVSSTLGGTLDVTGATILNNTFTVAGSGSSTLGGTLDVTGATILNNTFTVAGSGSSNFGGSLDVTGATVLEDTFTVSGTGATILGGTLNVVSATVLEDSLEVVGFSALNGGLTMDTDKFTVADTSGNTNIAGTLGVAGATELNGGLTMDTDKFTVADTSGNTNIAGTLGVAGATELNGGLTMDTDKFTVADTSGNTNIAGTLGVAGATELNGGLTMDTDKFTVADTSGNTNIAGTLRVAGATELNGGLTMDSNKFTVADTSGNTNIAGTLSVAGATQLNGGLTVDSNKFTVADASGNTNISGSLNVESGVTINGTDHPLIVQGGSNGIKIKVDSNSPTNSNNFLTFTKGNNNVVGRIEGENFSEHTQDKQYIYDTTIYAAEIFLSTAEMLGATVPRPGTGGGVGVVITVSACPSCVVAEIAIALVQVANLVIYNAFAAEDIGITYQSGSGDYAEWLERVNPAERISAGDVVGIYNGKISKIISENVQKILVISTSPAVLGNMPLEENILLNEKVAFLGQVPVKVQGDVFAGDYIIPSGQNNGAGVGVSKSDMKAGDYKNIIGVAWTSSLENEYDYVKIAIGLNSNDIADLVSNQQKEINSIENRISLLESKMGLTNNSSKSEIIENKSKKDININESVISKKNFLDKTPSEITAKMEEEAMSQVRDIYENMKKEGVDHKGLFKLINNNKFRSKTLGRIKNSYRKSYLRELAKYN